MSASASKNKVANECQNICGVICALQPVLAAYLRTIKRADGSDKGCANRFLKTIPWTAKVQTACMCRGC